jgi:hypothetical protein
MSKKPLLQIVTHHRQNPSDFIFTNLFDILHILIFTAAKV